MQFHPRRFTGIFLGTAWAVAFTVLLTLRGVNHTASLFSLVCYLAATLFFALAVLFAYWTYCCLTLRYALDRNGLSIHWGFVRQVIPLDKIDKMVRGKPGATPQVKGVNWFGHHIGRGQVEEIGETLFYATGHNPLDLVYVVTASQAYAVSPPDADRFLSEVETRRKEGVSVALRQVPRRLLLANQPFWHDRYALLLALAAIAVCVATFGVVFARYGDLAQSIPLSFPPLDVTRVAARRELLTLPTTAFGVLLANLILAFVIHTWERMVAYMLLVGLIALQGVFLWGAAIAVS
jgi:hypothetical protein